LAETRPPALGAGRPCSAVSFREEKNIVNDIDPAGLRILVVDDQATMRKIVRRLLMQVGIENVDEAANGEEALARLRNPRFEDPDVIVSDLHMDGIDGLELCNIIRRDERIRNRSIPIVVLTGDDDELIHEVSEQVGAVAVLIKPVSAKELFDSIQAAIGFSVDA
jgi:two-component system chemotaxis response regulator CheY